MEETHNMIGMQNYIDSVRLHNEDFSRRYNRQPLVYIRTYGCQQNVSDGEKLKGLFVEMGYVLASGVEEADVVLYNTCAVRENAEERVFGNVGALKHAKKRNPSMIIGLCGCMMQQEHIAQRIKQSFPFVDLVFGTHALHRLPELLDRKLRGQRRVFEITPSDGCIVEDVPVQRDGTVKAFLPIMYGCDNFCTYCVVPLVRGRERSREPERIIEEAHQLVQEGFREIMLLGQNVNSYGKTLDDPIPFSELLRRINAIEGDFRIRFMTSHPKDLTTDLMDAIAECDKVVKHLHLPVQSGSDRILAAMNRRYDSAQYLALIQQAKERIPGITFTSDIIVGFPGEQYEDFKQTLELIRRVEYLSLFTFVYSRRMHTKAAELEDPVPRAEKMRWFEELLAVQSLIGQQQYQSLVGKTLCVLPEAVGKTGEGYLTGRSESNIIVEFPAPESLIGHFVDVRIERALQWALLGEVVEQC